MHEIPADLAKSLRSYRGSIHSTTPQPADRTRSPVSDFSSEKDDERNASALILTNGVPNGVPNGSPIKPTPAPPITTKLDTTSPHKANMSTPIDPDPVAAREQHSKVPLTEPDFYELMGMKPPTEKGEIPKKLNANHGLYTTIVEKYGYYNKKYTIYDILVYTFLILQIILSAIFIVLGALRNIDSHTAVATLGAVSTVIGGVLALMKGQGLPNRLRMTRAGLSKVIFEAEELYWDVGAGRPVYFSDIKKIREDYLRVLEEANRNHPDTWNAAAAAMSSSKLVKGATGAPNNAPGKTG
ncbi:MAG: hypothetical protein M1820_010838 [Bogoriella megaspora]|nr:MAG: hypothetical protein M1820_010838 [Bogoriella megaspora]